MKTILLAEDQQIVRQGLKMMIEHNGPYRVLEAKNGEEAVQRYDQERVDLVLMDVRMPVMTGLEATKRIREKHPDSRIVMLTTFTDEAYALEALQSGALGYLLKDVDVDRLMASIQGALVGDMVLDGQVAAKVVPKLLQRTPHPKTSKPPHNLTERERVILRLVGEGKSNTEIARELYLTVGTVKNYVSHLLSKLGLRDRTQLAIYALKHDLTE